MDSLVLAAHQASPFHNDFPAAHTWVVWKVDFARSLPYPLSTYSSKLSRPTPSSQHLHLSLRSVMAACTASAPARCRQVPGQECLLGGASTKH